MGLFVRVGKLGAAPVLTAAAGASRCRQFLARGSLWLLVSAVSAACEVANPAYDITASGVDGGADDGGQDFADGSWFLPPIDGGPTLPIEPEPRLDAAVVMPPDAAVVAPPDAAVVVKPDAAVVVPPDAAIVVPPPDAALPKLDAPLAPDAAPVDRGCGADPDLLLCLDFDDGMASDKSALALNLNTSALGFESGPTGLALRSTTSTRIANLNTTQLTLASEVTIEAWIKPDRLPAVGARFGVLDYQPQYSLFLLPNGALSCGCDSFNFVMTAPIIAPAVWHSVACTLDANAVTIWVNGVAAATKSIPGLCRAGATAAGVSVLGNVPDNNTTARESLVGVSDNVRVWSRALTAAEICSDALVCL